MSKAGKFKETIFRVKGNLTSIDNQPLSKAALVIILFLDIFIITAIFNGLDQHTRQLSSPEDRIPPPCRQIVIDQHWNPTNRLDNLSQIILSHDSRYYPGGEKHTERHPVCAPYLDLIDQIKIDNELSLVFEDRSKFMQESRDLQREIGNLKGAYDSVLLENIAHQGEGKANVQALQKDIRQKTVVLNALKGKVTALDQKIVNNAKVKQLCERDLPSCRIRTGSG